MPSQKTFRTKRVLGKKAKQVRRPAEGGPQPDEGPGSSMAAV